MLLRDKALKFFELRTELGKELYEANPKSENLKNGLAISYYKLGGIYTTKGEKEKAHDNLKHAVAIWEKLFDANKLPKYKEYIESVNKMRCITK